MEKKYREFKTLGVLGLVSETFKLFWSHAGAFALILVTVVLPNVILSEGLEFGLSVSLSQYRFPSPIRIASAGDGQGRVAAFLDILHGHTGAAVGVASTRQILGAVILCALVCQACRALTVAALLHTVGLIYTGKVVSFLDMGNASPRRWGRLMVTGCWLIPVALLKCSTNVLLGVDWMLVLAVAPRFDLVYFVSSVMWTVSTIYIGLVTHVSEGVTVLEEDYGWASVTKSKKLMGSDGRFWVVAGVMFVLWMVPSALLGLLLGATRAQYFEAGPSNRVFVLLAVFYCLAKALLSVLSSLAGGVVYASCKAHLGESIDYSKFSVEENGVYGADGAGKINTALLTA